MASLLSKAGIVLAALVGILYQFAFKNLIFHTFGYGRTLTPIHTFNVHCERVAEPGLEACEDVWLHQPTGYLYMACSDTESRAEWMPAVSLMNASGRGLNDHLVVLDTRGSGSISSRLRRIAHEDFSGVKGDGTINLHGLDVWVDENTDTLKVLLVNHRPPIDPITGIALNAAEVGANSTIELFETKIGSSTMHHVKTYFDPLIQTPNRVTWVSEDAFLFTNDCSGKVGLRRHLDLLIGGGSVVYCDSNHCHEAYTSGFAFPNGLTRGLDGLIYVPQSITGVIDVFSLTADKVLKKITTIKTPYPLDNLSVDKNGDIYGAAFPQLHKLQQSHEVGQCPSAVVKVSKGQVSSEDDKGGYVVEMVVEDDGNILPGSTVAVHDAETGRLFTAGVKSPWITICETR